jgi:pyruvate dehydrogenase E2 component (dihydrolipoamide acetyltransferase)
VPVEVYMPKMSDHMESGTIISWLVEEGAVVEERQPIFEVETDKAIAEVEAPASGVLRGIRAGEGAVVPVGEVIAFIAEHGEEVPGLPSLEPEAKPEALASTVAMPPSDAPPKRIRAAPTAPRLAGQIGVDLSKVRGTGPQGRIEVEDVRRHAELAADRAPQAAAQPVPASPTGRKLAKEHGIDLRQVQGTGPGGRISKRDVLAYIQSLLSEGVPPQTGDEQAFKWLELSSVRRITAKRMALSKQIVPHFYLTMEVDMTEATRVRGQLMDQVLAETGARLSYTALLVMAVSIALRRHPLANAEFSSGRIKVHRKINIGVAIGSEQGLVVPVVHDADAKSLGLISRELSGFQEKRETLRFSPDELSGGTFTITNLGMFGVQQFTPIINAPQSAILAAGCIVDKPTWLQDGSLARQPVVKLTLAVDHRVMDGVSGARFLSDVKAVLQDLGSHLPISSE